MSISNSEFLTLQLQVIFYKSEVGFYYSQFWVYNLQVGLYNSQFLVYNSQFGLYELGISRNKLFCICQHVITFRREKISSLASFVPFVSPQHTNLCVSYLIAPIIPSSSGGQWAQSHQSAVTGCSHPPGWWMIIGVNSWNPHAYLPDPSQRGKRCHPFNMPS